MLLNGSEESLRRVTLEALCTSSSSQRGQPAQRSVTFHASQRYAAETITWSFIRDCGVLVSS